MSKQQPLQEATKPIQFFVPGVPKPAGSKRAFMNAWTKKIVVTDDCKKSGDWKGDVKAFAFPHRPAAPLTGPLRLTVRFVMPRPKSHFLKSGLRPDAPACHTSKPDATKLLRCIEDALTSLLWVDDAQISWQEVTKSYGLLPGAFVEVEAIT